MLSGLRRLINSTLGKLLALAVLVVIGIAFAAGDISSWHLGSGTAKSSIVATIDGEEITDQDVTARAQTQLMNIRQQNPDVTMQQFLDAGLLDQVVDDMVNGKSLEAYAKKLGMHVTDKQVDAEIASIPAFQGLDGKFDQKTYEQLLASRQLNSTLFRADVRRSLLARMLIDPISSAKQMPATLAQPYASTLLEQRNGQALLIPIQAFGPGAAPTDAEIKSFYQSHAAKYLIPERRVMRYALMSPSSMPALGEPSEAEIASAYKAGAARFAPSEDRTLEQVIVGDEAGAKALADKVRKGMTMTQAARAVGLEAQTIKNVKLKDYIAQSGAAIAQAAFAAKQGDVLVPGKAALGWPVVRVAAVNKIPGKTLDQARPDLIKDIKERHAAEALADLQNRIDDGISNGSTFDQLVADNKLTAQKTGALIANGIDTDQPTQKPDDTRTTLAKAGFDMQQGDSPQLVAIGSDGSFALVALDKVVAAGPPPLEKIKDRVAVDFRIDRALEQARKAAAQVVAAADKGESFAKAAAATGLKLPPIRDFSVKRIDIARQPDQQIPTPVKLLFSMKPRTAQLTRVNEGGPTGYFVVYLDKVVPGDATGNADLLVSTRNALGGVIGRELAEQFVKSVKDEIGVKQNADALKRVRSQLTGSGAADQGS